jgi:hypothetical protein
MKTLKSTLMLALLLCLSFNLSQSQNRSFWVHQDNVKPSMVGEYEKIAKEFNEACKTNNVQTSWITATTSDFRYMYVSEIENMADLDKRPFAEMAKAMGDAWGDLFDRFDKCYDSHGGYIITMDEELTYMPDGFSQTQEGQDFRNYFYLYYKPKNHAKIREGMKAVKEMFASKGSSSHYRVYRSGFGTMGSYYMVAISSKDEIDSATSSKANDELLGPDRYETFNKVMNYVSKFEEYSGSVRPDLGYSPAEKQE